MAPTWSEEVSAGKLGELMQSSGFVGEDVVKRLAELERQLAEPGMVDRFQKNDDFQTLQVKLNNLHQKIQEAEYMVWLGFQKNLKPKPMNAGRRPGSVDKAKNVCARASPPLLVPSRLLRSHHLVPSRHLSSHRFLSPAPLPPPPPRFPMVYRTFALSQPYVRATSSLVTACGRAEGKI